MEHCFVRLMSFSNQKSIKQFSRYELKKKATVLVYIFENDRLAPSDYNYETANWKNIKASLKERNWSEILKKNHS